MFKLHPNMLLLNKNTLAGIMCAFSPCQEDGFKKYASLFRKVTLLSVLCTPALYCRLVLIWQGCITSLREAIVLQEIISFKEVVIL